MDLEENNRLAMASTIRPVGRTQLPVPQTKPSLHEMTESQSNSRATGLPLPSTSLLKHKATDFAEPPSKQRKVAPHSTEMRRPASALGTSRLAASTNTARPPSRPLLSASQSIHGRRVPASNYGQQARPLSQSSYRSNGAKNNHLRAKSQNTGLRPPSRAMNQCDDEQSATNDWNNPLVIENRIAMMEGLYQGLKSQMEGTTFERSSMKELIEAMRARIEEVEAVRDKQETVMASLRSEYDELKLKAQQMTLEADLERRTLENDIEDLKRRHRYEVDDLQEQHRREMDRITNAACNGEENARKESQERIRSTQRDHESEISRLVSRHLEELREEKDRRICEVEELARQRDQQIEKIATTIGNKEREADTVREELTQKLAELEREKSFRQSLESQLHQKAAEIISLNGSNQAIKAQVEFLESNNQQQSSAFATLHRQTQDAIAARDEAIEKLRAEETLRRKLHNQVQELKGNIRVFCRVRPMLDEGEVEGAKLKFPDQEEESKEVVVFGAEQKSSLGTVTRPQHAFSFDRVFDPSSDNGQIFDEISQLIQSALDGYNVCIFCYGQTGSGKTFTMSSADGMIPRAVRQIYSWAKALEEKGWQYSMEGSFVEVYNENLNDLLGRAEEFDKKKHEIRHDSQKLKTTITDVETVPLDSPEAVEEVLARADRNRSVAATKANQRSSRSHSVFILSLVGENSITGERSEGTLNLVDLAGSERLAHSQAEGQRLKETQNINKSLSCLGDVIGALGRGDGGHIPYRNSKLTYLLQYSLGGNSKTLMFVMISPLQAHLSETLTSLKFATKVHNTHIGTAKKQSRVKE